MITAVEIRKKTERKYVDYLRSVVAGSEFEPIVIPCDEIKLPLKHYLWKLRGLERLWLRINLDISLL